MILRRITEHVKAQNWTAVAIDFLIVVVGVFIGIQVSNWNDAQGDKRIAREYIERIQEDLLANQVNLESRIGYYNGIKSHAIRALSALEGPHEELGEAFLIDAYQASNVIATPIVRDAYDELLSVGAVNTVADAQVRQHLANYYQTNTRVDIFLRKIPLYRDALRSAMPYDIQLKIRTLCRSIIIAAKTGLRSISLPEECEPDLTQEQVSRGVAAISAVELKSDLTRAAADAKEKQDIYEGIIFFSRQLHEVLEETK